MYSLISSIIAYIIPSREGGGEREGEKIDATQKRLGEIIRENQLIRVRYPSMTEGYYYDGRRCEIWEVCLSRIGEPIFIKPKRDIYNEIIEINRLPISEYIKQRDMM